MKTRFFQRERDMLKAIEEFTNIDNSQQYTYEPDYLTGFSSNIDYIAEDDFIESLVWSGEQGARIIEICTEADNATIDECRFACWYQEYEVNEMIASGDYYEDKDGLIRKSEKNLIPSTEELIEFVQNDDFAFCTNGGRTVLCDFDSTTVDARAELVEMIKPSSNISVEIDDDRLAEFDNDDDADCTILNIDNRLWIAYF